MSTNSVRVTRRRRRCARGSSIGIASLLGATGVVNAQAGWQPQIGGSGLNNNAYAAVRWDPDGPGGAQSEQIVAAGDFTVAGSTGANRIARWDGSTWHAFGAGITFNGSINALAVFDEDGTGPAIPALFAAGSFTSISQPAPTSINHIAKWTGSAWADVGAPGQGVNGIVHSLYVSSVSGTPVLHVGGAFSTAGAVPAANIAGWNGAAWSALGAGADASVHAMADFNDGFGLKLYVGGTFGAPAPHIASWNGSVWTPVAGGLNNHCFALTVHNDGAGPALYAGGLFTVAGSSVASRIARWNGTAWSPVQALPGEGADNRVYALASFDAGDGMGPSLYAGGDFINAGGVAAQRLARYDCGAWSPLNAGADGRVRALLDGPAQPNLAGLWALGEFTTIDLYGSGHIARYHAPDCNSNGIPDAIDLCDGATPCPLDCNNNCILDSCDIASGYSLDCNHNGVPDECDPPCPPTQATLPDGGGCGGPPPTPAWLRSVIASQAWFQRDGDPIFGKGEGVIGWRNRPADSSYIYNQFPRPASNLGVFQRKIKRTRRGAQDCEGRHTYNFNQINRLVYSDEGPDYQDVLSNTIDAQVDFWFVVSEKDKRKLSIKSLEDYLRDAITPCDAPTKAYFFAGKIDKFLLDPLHDERIRPIAQLICPTAPAHPDPSSGSCPTESDISCAPQAPDTIEWAFHDTLGGKPAHLQLNWNVASNGYLGQRFTDPDNDRTGGTRGGEIIKYEYQQRNGSQLLAKVYMHRDHLVYDLSTVGQQRVFRYLFDIDNNPLTGDVAIPYCGADYDVRVTLTVSTDQNHQPQICVDSRIFAWCGGEWADLGTSARSVEALFDRAEIIVNLADIGICQPGRAISSWVVVQNNANIADYCPNDPCGTRLCLTIAPDAECPHVIAWHRTTDANGDITSIDVDLSEPVMPVTAADVVLKLQGAITPTTVSVAMLPGDATFIITPGSGGVFPSGIYDLLVKDTIKDYAGNHLDGNLDRICGGDAGFDPCIEDADFETCDGEGNPVDQFDPSATIYFKAQGFNANQTMDLYAVDPDALTRSGETLIDLTDDGFDTVTALASGVLDPASLGHALHARELKIVADINQNGSWDPGIDLANGWCGAAFVVGDPCQDGIEDMIASWNFDEAPESRAANESQAGNNALYGGSPSVVPGVVGNALSFAANDSLLVPDDPELDLGAFDFTIEFWIRRQAGNSGASIIEKNAGNGFLVTSNGADINLIVNIDDGHVPGYSLIFPSLGSPITPGTWRHVAFVADRENTGVLALYVDGQLNTSYTGMPASDLNNTSDLSILKLTGPRDLIALDELFIYDRALDPSEISHIYKTHSHCIDMPPCPPDFNDDGVINSQDFFDFINAFFLSAPDADFNQDGAINSQDFFDFLGAFFAGC